ncbi:MAG: S-layer homology domain-containing protein [Bacillota bacterium]|nr:S-layer homology domain-containing protein [Bacillota bacterium]
MKLLNIVIGIVLLISVFFSSFSAFAGETPDYSSTSSETKALEPALDAKALEKEKHWVYEELADFKQKIYPVFGPESKYDGISEEDKNSIREIVFNEDYLNQPIKVEHWAVLLDAVLGIPDEDREKLLRMYVYNLATEDEITREDAVGGMVKLLTMQYLKGDYSYEELEAAKDLKDLDTASDRQDTLVRIAYCAGLLDTKTTDYFRPRERLTAAEAISMLYRVVTKYGITYNDTGKVEVQKPDIPVDKDIQVNWVDVRIQQYRDKLQKNLVKLKTAESILLDGRIGNDDSLLSTAVTVEKWREALRYTLEIDDDDILDYYTIGLVEGNTVPRDIAAAGMVKLLHCTGAVKGRDASEQELLEAAAAFTDYNDAFDISKLAIAYSEGLIKGYPDRTFRPKQALTNGEALILMLNIMEKTE